MNHIKILKLHAVGGESNILQEGIPSGPVPAPIFIKFNAVMKNWHIAEGQIVEQVAQQMTSKISVQLWKKYGFSPLGNSEKHERC